MEGALDDGMGFDGSSITGFNAIEESDMVAIPDPATFQVMPWPIDEHGHEIGAKVARLICDVVKPDGTPYEGDPRFVLRAALDRMQGLGFDAFNVGPELEYFLFEDDTDTKTLDEGGYFAMTAQDAATEVRNDTIHALESVGILIEYHHHEVALSRHEIDMRYADALAMAEYTITYRMNVKEVAAWHGYYATFMPKPLFRRERLGDAHAHVFQERPQPVLRRERPAPSVHDREVVHRGPARPRPRDVRRAGAVGQSRPAARPRVRGAGLRRMVAAKPLGADPDPALQAGRRAGDAGRDPPPRPRLQPVPGIRRAAARGPRGIERGYELLDEMTTNLYQFPRRSAASVASSRPGLLGEAAEQLAGSELMQRALGEHIFPRYVELKRAEWNEYRIQVSEWEKQRYLSVL